MQQPCAARATVLTSSQQVHSAWLRYVQQTTTYIHIAGPGSPSDEKINAALVDAAVRRHADVTILNEGSPRPETVGADQRLATAGCHIIYDPSLFRPPEFPQRIVVFDGATAIMEMGEAPLTAPSQRAVLLENDPAQVAKIEAQWFQVVLHSIPPADMVGPATPKVRPNSRSAKTAVARRRLRSSRSLRERVLNSLGDCLYSIASLLLSLKILDFLINLKSGSGYRDLSPLLAHWLELMRSRSAFLRRCVSMFLTFFRWPPLMLLQSIVMVRAPNPLVAIYGIIILFVAICLAITCAFNQFHAGQYKYTSLVPFGLPRGQANKQGTPILPTPAVAALPQKEQVVIFVRILRGLLAATIFGYAGIYNGLIILGGPDVLHGLSPTEPLWLQTLYFSVVLTSTVGFGDIYATTAWGQVFVMAQCITSFSLVVILLAMFSSTVGADPTP
ncbi:MAG: two pore domain potassium channel family protein [Ktedonobacteraceae bacterium]|nr:two pore domain potassium channel family protein [Ktedonobacteraceae bacterium]